jgi:hypothetical protein
MLAFTLFVVSAFAQDSGGVSVEFSENFEFRHRSFEPEGLVLLSENQPTYFEQVNRLVGNASSEKWSGWLQLDEVAIVGMPYLLDGERTATPPELYGFCDQDTACVFAPFGNGFYMNLEKFGSTWKAGDLTIALGDVYASFGLGAALNITRRTDIDVDTSIQGVRADVLSGDWEATAVIGQANRQQVLQNNPNLGLTGDRRHLIAGARVARYGLGPAAVGLHGVSYNFVEDYGFGGSGEGFTTTPDAIIGGGTLELFGVGGFDVMLEGDAFAYPTDTLFPSTDPTTGYAVVGSAATYLGATAWQLEAKHTVNANRANFATAEEQYLVVQGPTLEYDRAIRKDSAVTLGSNALSGGLLRLDLMITGVTPYISFAIFHDRDETSAEQSSPVRETITHTLVGLDYLNDEWSVLANLGFRNDDRQGDQWGYDRLMHGDLAWRFPLPSKLHGDLNLGGARFLGGPNPADEEVHGFTEVETATSIMWESKVGGVFYADQSNNPAAGLDGNVGASGFMAGELIVRPHTSWTFKLFHGAQKAGLRCAGGQCRLVPSFDGTRLSVAASF